ncbi:pectin acetylesterase 8-like [Salvia hispanica]|uniref:pectin acetylesterase 8-like n=1 Tax=Salvia hispanica TaxID=49212 RepID=UPI0020094BF8|nr:pectin acetylesterase 8-like [Salvia hispanica]
MGSHIQGTNAIWLKIIIYLLVFIEPQVNSQNIDQELNVTFITNAVKKGAVCLDGSPGAYYFAKGFGDGVHNWMIYLPGGAWCNSTDECLRRSKNDYVGSNKNVAPMALGTIQSQNKSLNPDFYNWNKVYIRYCDGASFMADVETVNPETKLHLRGRRIFASVLEELITTKGMSNAENALLVGNSAGGLAAILNCDRFHSFLPGACRVKCISDSGVFIQGNDLHGAQDIAKKYFASVVKFHELDKYLPQSCTRRLDPELCFIPGNVVEDIQTPLFLLHSNFDLYQISKLAIPNHPNNEGWENCTKNFSSLQSCTSNQLHVIMDIHRLLLKTLEGLVDNPSRGLFIISCYIHDISTNLHNWQGIPILQNKTIQQAIGDWYFDKSNVQIIDTQHSCPINCDRTID